MRKILSGIAGAAICLLLSLPLHSQLIITTTATPSTQNFNTLRATAGTSTTLPAGWKLLETGTGANTSYASDAGGTATGNTYSYGTGTATERAFGALRSGSVSPVLGVQIRNSTGSTITSMTITYTGEQWRCGATGRADQLDFQYSLNATSLSTGTWTDNNTLDFASPSTTTVGAKDGNAAANRSVKTTTITGLSIANNGLFWLRWNDLDASGADDGLSIDDFSIQLNGSDVTAPTASTFNPANSSTNIALTGNLVVTFSENIQKGTAGNITVKRSSDNVTVQTTAVTAATVTVAGATATIPFSGLAYSTGYYVNIDAGAFKDIAGNNFAGITATTTWGFTTMAAPSASVAVNPASLNFGFTAFGLASAAQSFSFTTTNITAALTLTAPASFELSKTGTTFSSSLSYTIAEAQAGQTVFARFVPAAANTTYSGAVNFSSTGLNTNAETLSGNSVVSGGGSLNHYFGNLHSHSSYSDGNADNTTKVPSDDYTYAKTALCMDFLGISEHNHATAGMSISNWQPGRAQAAAATTSTFVGMYGMEWGTISAGGHVIIYGVDSLIGWEAGNYDIFVDKFTYQGANGLFDRITRHGNNAIAYLAHPNTGDYNGLVSTFNAASDEAVVGSAVESGPAFSTNTTYTNPATSMSYLTYYRNMLSRGYHVGPTIDHDNHNMTFGHTAKSRLVVMAATLSESTLLDGMKKMRFYASQDCSAKISFTVNTESIGSIITRAGAPVIALSSTGTTSAISSVSIMSGVPGSGTAATLLTSFTSGSFSYTDNSLANGSQRYYYLDITEADGSRIVTSPIWYTRNDAARMTAAPVTSFFTVNETERVILKWTTENEELYQTFEVLRSTDGGNSFQSLSSVNGKGFAFNTNTYAFTDAQPFAGMATYRLVQRNQQGQIRYTDMKVVDRSATPITYFTAYPNPVSDQLQVRVSAMRSGKATAEVYDMNGRRMMSQSFNAFTGIQTISMNLGKLGNGTYLLKVTVDGKTGTQLINKF